MQNLISIILEIDYKIHSKKINKSYLHRKIPKTVTKMMYIIVCFNF